MSVLLLILELRQILFIRDLTRNLEIENTPVLETGASYGYHVSNEKFVKVNAVDFYVIVTSFRVTESYCYFEAVLFDFQQESQAEFSTEATYDFSSSIPTFKTSLFLGYQL